MRSILAAIAVILLLAPSAQAQDTFSDRKPEATIDLATREGAQLIKGEWRYSDIEIIQTDFKAAGPDGQPGAAANKTYDFTPHAGGIDFDDSKWEVIDPTTLDKRRSAGRLAFNWYRIRITIPERIGAFDAAGSTLVFETSVDDYAEIWVDGELPRAAGQSGGSVIKGWNAENRLIVGRNVKAGQKIQLAIFGINGPISNVPTNYIYVRYAKLEFHRIAAGPVVLSPQEVNVEVVRLDPAIDAIVPLNPKLFKLAEGFQSMAVHDEHVTQIADVNGNRYVIGSGGIRVLSTQGKHLGTILPSKPPQNLSWGDDGKSLYLAARDGLYRMPLLMPGVRPAKTAARR